MIALAYFGVSRIIVIHNETCVYAKENEYNRNFLKQNEISYDEMVGWNEIDGEWYYFYDSGAMAVNSWVGNYYLGADGKMVRNAKVGNYIVGSDGMLVTKNTFMNGYYYRIDSAGNIISETKSMYGIDISQWNGDIDLSAYRDGFIIIRAGYGWSIENEDTYLRKNIAKCNALGIPYGIYWYSYATNVDYAQKEAAAFNSVLKNSGANPTLGVWMDIENDSYKKDKMNWGHETLDPIVKTLSDLISANGYKTGVYASYNDFEKNISTTYRKWVAHWGADNDGSMIDLSNYGAAIHQYTSAGGLDKDFIYDTSYFE